MSNIVERLQECKADLYAGKGAAPARIAEAEKALGVRFAGDYSQYLQAFGVVAVDGHELTGISDVARIDVVEVTQRQRRGNPDISPEWYVVEEANIDGIVIWQDAQGNVFGGAAGVTPIQIADNLVEYLNL